MNIAGKYNNYDPHPKKVIPGFEDQAWEGVPAVKAELTRKAEDILSFCSPSSIKSKTSI